MGVTGGGRRRFGAVLLAMVLAGACAGPELTISTEPEEALLFVDGRRELPGSLPFRYYGSVAVDAMPAPDDESARFPDRGTRERVDVDEPVTPWIFPLDFFGELLVRAFHGVEDRSVTIRLPPNPVEVVSGFEPAGGQELLQRARAARVAR